MNQAILDNQPTLSRASFWKTVLPYGALHFIIMGISAPLIDLPQHGCMFITPAYFIVLVIVLPILILRRFWAGTTVFIPYATLGFFPAYYFEWMTNQSLKSVWGVVAWCLIGPLVGLLGDLTFKFLPRRVSEQQRAIITGAVIGAAIFLTTLVALTTLYKVASMDSHLRYFTQGWYFSLPWLVINGGFAGYTAHMLSTHNPSKT